MMAQLCDEIFAWRIQHRDVPDLDDREIVQISESSLTELMSISTSSSLKIAGFHSSSIFKSDLPRAELVLARIAGMSACVACSCVIWVRFQTKKV